jgi:tetratricopeptide (TPR) repeat protein
MALSLAVLATGCALSRPAPARRAAATSGPVRLYALDEKPVALVHASAPEPTNGAVLTAGRPIGAFEPPPAVRSARNQARVETANRLYDARDYAGALTAIEPAYLDERDNPFVIETYARVLYRKNERAQAFVLYRQLVDLLDAERKESPDSVTVDLWFVDAYWKVGTLHMDRREWARATFEISRALVGGLAWEPLAEEQALSYLTKAYFELGRHEEARYYAERALGRNPRNTYARQYLDRLPRDPKER